MSNDRYFRVTSGPLMDAAHAIVEERRAAFEVCDALCKEVGASGFRAFSDGRFAGFTFDAKPDALLWKAPNRNGLYWPSKASAAGKDLFRRVAKLPTLRDLSYAVEAVGLTPHFPVLIEGRTGSSSSAFGSPRLGVMFVRVPWKDEDPAELAAYKEQRDSGNRTRWSATLDHLLWQPTADMVEVKEWEVLREIDYLNAQLKEAA